VHSLFSYPLTLAFYLLTTRHLPDFATATTDSPAPAPAPLHPYRNVSSSTPPRMGDPHPVARASYSPYWLGRILVCPARRRLKVFRQVIYLLISPALFSPRHPLLASDSSGFINVSVCNMFVLSFLLLFLDYWFSYHDAWRHKSRHFAIR